MLTSEQIRAARALLRWEQKDLAEASKVSLPTVKRLEGKAGEMRANAVTLDALERALTNAGIEFTNGDAPGVRLRLRPAVSDHPPLATGRVVGED